MTETGGQPPVSFPVKDVAVLLFLLRRLTRRGINAACGQCPASGWHGTGALPLRAGVDARVRFAAAVTRSLLPVCRDFPVVRPLRFRGLTLQLPPAVCVRLRLPLRPVHPRLIARLLWRHGTARCRGICEQRRKTSCNMRNLSL